MSDNLYREFADITSLEKQKEQILKIFEAVQSGAAKLSELGIKMGKGGSVKEVAKDINQYEVALRELEKLKKQYASGEAQLQLLRQKESEQLIAQKIALKELKKEQELRVKLRNSEAGSLEQMNLKLQKATQIINQFSEAQRNSARGQNFIKFAGQLSSQINEIQKSAGNFRANVGRYAESLGAGFEMVRREISRLKQEADNLEKSGDPAGASRVRRSIEDLDRVQKVSFNGNQSFAKSVKQIERAYQDLATKGGVSNEFLKEFRKFAAEAKDQAGDLREEIKALSSDTRKIDLAVGGLGTLASGYETLVGAQALFGDENEEVQKSLQKLVAVQTVANGVRSLATDLTTRGTLANKFYAFTQGLLATALDRSAASAVRFKAAMGLIAIAATVVGGLIIALQAFSKSQSAAEKSQENLNTALREGSGEYAKALEQVTSLKINLDLAKKGMMSKKEVVDQYNTSIGTVAGEVRDLDGVEQGLIKNADAYIQMTYAKAVATAALAQAAKLAVDAQQDERELLQDADKFSTLVGNLINPSMVKKSAERKVLESRAEVKKQIDDLLKFASEQQEKAAMIFSKMGFRTKTDSDKKGGDNPEDRKAKAILDAKKLELEGQAAIEKEIMSMEMFTYSERFKALQNYIKLKNEIIDLDTEYELSKKGLLEEEKILIQKKAEQAKIDLARTSGVKVADIAIESAEEIEETIQDIPENVADVVTQATENIETQLKASVEAYAEWSKELQDRSKTLKETLIQTFQDAFTGIFDAKKNRIQEEIDEIERLKAAEIDRINQTTEREEEKAARIKIVEAKAQADREALERRQRAIDRQRIIFERMFKGSQIAMEGIRTIGELKARLAVAIAASTTNPFMARAIPLIAAQIPITAATTAAQLVSLLAVPIPKFASGTLSSPEGAALVGEAGRELSMDPGGRFKLFDRPALTYLKKGTRIFPNRVTEAILSSAKPEELLASGVITPKSKDDEIVGQLKKLNDKNFGVFIKADSNITFGPWFDRNIKN